MAETLGELSDPVEIQHEAAHILGEHLDVDHAHYAEVGDDGDTFRVHAEFYRGDVPSVAGEHQLSDYGEYIVNTLHAGENLVLTDTQSAPELSDDDRAACASGDNYATVAVPLVRDGRLVSVFSVDNAQAREWSDAEVEMVEETAERTWTAVERAQAEEELREKEERLAAATDTADIGVWELDLQTNEGIYTSTRYAEILGYDETPEDWNLEQAFEHYDPDDRERLMQYLEEGIGERTFESQITRTDGEQRWISVEGEVYEDSDGTPVRAVGTMQDITERKRREKHQDFLLEFSDALRAQPDEQSIKDKAVTMLAEHLDLDRCWISEVFEQDGISTVGPEHIRPDLQPMSGVFELSEYPETMRQLATQRMVIEEAATDPHFSDAEKELFAGFDLQALLVVPLRKGERDVIWALAAAMDESRQWTDGERALLEDAAERTWSAVERTRAEEDIREKEERLSAATDAAELGILELDLQTDDGPYISPRYAEIYGYDEVPDDWTVEKALDHIHPDDREQAEAGFEEAVETGSVERESRLIRPDGEQRWIKDRAEVHYEDGEPARLVDTVQDITERKRREEEIREKEERYRTLFESMDEGYCIIEMIFDEDDEPVDYRFVETNSAFGEQFGIGDVDGRRMLEINPEHESYWFDIYGRIAKTGEPQRFTDEVEGVGRLFDVYAYRIGEPEEHRVAVLFENITERKEREQRLERQREQIEELKDRLLETSPTGILTVDETGEITLANDRATEILGMNHEELVGLTHDAPEFGVVDSNGEPMPDGKMPFEQVSAAGEAVFDIELGATRADGERIWLSVNVAPLYSDANAPTEMVVGFEDITEHKQANEALAHLNDTSRELMDADATEIIDRAAAITQEVTGVEYASLWRYDDEAGDLELHTASTASGVEEIGYPEGFGERAWQVFVSNEMDVDNDLPPAPDIAASEEPLRSGVIVPLGRHGIIYAGSVRPDEFDERTTSLAETVAANVETALDRADDEQQLEAQNTELTQLNRLNTIIREIDAVLVQADTREEIEQVVCERLAESDLYEFAWVGATEPGAESVESREWDGIDPGPLDRLTTDGGLVGTARRTREPQVIEDIVTDARSASWREQALERGVRSCISVPLHYEESLYGVLTVYANRPQSNGRECEVFEELGETIAHAINAAETKQALGAEGVIELGLELREPDTVLSRLAAQTSCDIEFEGLVPGSGDASNVFFTARGTSFDAIHAAADESTAIEELSCITDYEEDHLCKALVTGPTLSSSIVEQNATIRSLTIVDGTLSAVVDLPQADDVREFIESIQTTFPDVELTSRRTHEHPMQTREGFRAAFEERLTDRQQEVLRTAYLSGFFKSPRETTGQDLADVLDVSQSTFAQHLRAGQHNHFELLFDEA